MVPNLFPAFESSGSVERQGLGVFDLINGVGVHEVIIESPSHDIRMADMAVEDVAAVARAYRDRIIHLHRDPRLRYVLIFKNHGEQAGASLHHPHSQLIATPITPWPAVPEVATVAADRDTTLDALFAWRLCLRWCSWLTGGISHRQGLPSVWQKNTGPHQTPYFGS